MYEVDSKVEISRLLLDSYLTIY